MKVKTRHVKCTHKFGIEVPRNVTEAHAIDAKTGTDFWAKAIERERHNVWPAFDVWEDGKVPVRYKEIQCHLVFDIKSDTLAWKAQFVAGGHLTDPPKELTYSSVVSRDSIQLFFLIAALNDVNVLYLPAMFRMHTWMPKLKRRCGFVEAMIWEQTEARWLLLSVPYMDSNLWVQDGTSIWQIFFKMQDSRVV